MTRAEALRKIAALHTAWSLEHGDTVPYVAEHANPHPGSRSDLSVWQADRSAPPEIDDPLNAKIKAILAQIDDVPTNHLPGKHDQSSHGRRRGLRPSLAKAKTVEEVAGVLASEASRLTGDTVTADFSGADLEVARQFAEGVLAGVQRYPATPLREIGTFGPGGSDTHNGRMATQSPREKHAMAFALRGGEGNSAGGMYSVPDARMPGGTTTTGTAIYLNNGTTAAMWTSVASVRQMERDGRLSGRAQVTSTPREVALHEFGHSIGKHGRPYQPEYMVGLAAQRLANDAGQDRATFVKQRVSRYAASNDAELTAEVFADVMANGSKATQASKDLFRVMEANVRGWEAEVT